LQKQQIQEKKVPVRPRFIIGWPEWWHAHGMKIHLGDPQNLLRHLRNETVLLRGSAVIITIRRILPDEWSIKYEILHEAPSRTAGIVHMNTLQLEAAFALREKANASATATAYLARFGGVVGIPGKFIRYERWLNIPGPGTGIDGDPNVSIELHKEIKDALKQVISARR
jgi:hypothetical protein